MYPELASEAPEVPRGETIARSEKHRRGASGDGSVGSGSGARHRRAGSRSGTIRFDAATAAAAMAAAEAALDHTADSSTLFSPDNSRSDGFGSNDSASLLRGAAGGQGAEDPAAAAKAASAAALGFRGETEDQDFSRDSGTVVRRSDVDHEDDVYATTTIRPDAAARDSRATSPTRSRSAAAESNLDPEASESGLAASALLRMFAGRELTATERRTAEGLREGTDPRPSAHREGAFAEARKVFARDDGDSPRTRNRADESARAGGGGGEEEEEEEEKDSAAPFVRKTEESTFVEPSSAFQNDAVGRDHSRRAHVLAVPPPAFDLAKAARRLAPDGAAVTSGLVRSSSAARRSNRQKNRRRGGNVWRSESDAAFHPNDLVSYALSRCVVDDRGELEAGAQNTTFDFQTCFSELVGAGSTALASLPDRDRLRVSLERFRDRRDRGGGGGAGSEDESRSSESDGDESSDASSDDDDDDAEADDADAAADAAAAAARPSVSAEHLRLKIKALLDRFDRLPEPLRVTDFDPRALVDASELSSAGADGHARRSDNVPLDSIGETDPLKLALSRCAAARLPESVARLAQTNAKVAFLVRLKSWHAGYARGASVASPDPRAEKRIKGMLEYVLYDSGEMEVLEQVMAFPKEDDFSERRGLRSSRAYP